MVNKDNYEEYMMLYVDGELNDAAQQALVSFIEQHPEFAVEFRLYKQICMQPDRSQVFPDKDSLLQPVPAVRAIRLDNWKTYSAAAAVLLLVVFVAARWLRPGAATDRNTVASVKQSNQGVVNATPVDVQVPQELGFGTAGEASRPSVQAKASAPVAKQNNRSKAEETWHTAASSGHEQLVGISPVSYSLFGAPELALVLQPVHLSPEVAIESPDSGTSPISDLLALLPEEKKQVLQILKLHIDDKRHQAKAIRENLKETQFALRLGNKDLFVINF